MEIKPAYPLAAPENQLAVLAKIRGTRYADSEVGSEVQDVTLQYKYIKDIVDITPDDFIQVDLDFTRSSRSVRDPYAIMYSLSPNRKEKGTVIDIWA